MTAYLENIILNHPVVYRSKQILHNQFYKQAQIPHAVSIIYYPIQYGIMSHVEFEFEGACINLRNGKVPFGITNPKSYHKRVFKIRRNVSPQPELAFIRIGIYVTPKQIKKINQEIDGIMSMIGLNCMHGVNRVIKRYTDYSVPFPISLFPTMSAGYLILSKKIFSSHKISMIDPQVSHRPRGHQVADAVLGTAQEIVAIALTISYLYLICYLYSLNKKTDPNYQS